VARVSEEFTDSMTVGEARTHLQRAARRGTSCPCCRRFVKAYRRTIHTSTALGAIKLDRATTTGEYAHLRTVEGMEAGNNGAMLRYWGLVTEESERREDGGRSGWWCLTDDGRAFVEGSHRVPK
jgi:hypothetical protein